MGWFFVLCSVAKYCILKPWKSDENSKENGQLKFRDVFYVADTSRRSNLDGGVFIIKAYLVFYGHSSESLF